MPVDVFEQHKDKLVGVWKCISYDMYDSDGPGRKFIAKPHGEQPMGRASVSSKGWLAAHLARPERMVPFKSGNKWQTGTDAEVAHVARGISMYCGYLKLYEDNEGLYWQTVVEVASDPERIGGIEERRLNYWEENGKSFMTLKPKRDMLLEVSNPSAMSRRLVRNQSVASKTTHW
jgi:hypothetical protein